MKNSDQHISSSSIIPKLLLQTKWSRSSLTYSIRSYPKQLNESITKNLIRQAFKTWSDHIPLTIEETCPTCQSDFIIQFMDKDESVDYPFDGIGGTLSHTYFPEDGRLIFDKDEIWTDRLESLQFFFYLRSRQYK